MCIVNEYDISPVTECKYYKFTVHFKGSCTGWYKEENIIIKEDNKETHKQLTKIINRTIFNKYTKAIQYVNRLEQFEKQLNNPKYMIQLREDRVDDCHYINDNDTQDEQKKKMNILYEKINNMSNEVKKMFNRRYPNLINNISSLIPYDNTIIMTH